MSCSIELSAAALADFDHIYDSIAKHNPASATRLLRRLDQSIQLLATQPRLGKSYRHGRLELRLLILGDYLIFYRKQHNAINIIRVLHGKQNIPDILDEL